MEDYTKADYRDTSSAVDAAKQYLGIGKLNAEMTDEEIRTVCKWIGEKAPDTVWAGDKPVFGRMGISAMLFIALTEFPEFYEKYRLSQFN